MTISTNSAGNDQQAYKNIRVATINVITLQDDIKLTTCIQTARECKIDITAMQEVRRTGSGCMTFDDESLKNWQFIWGGHKQKKVHGVAIILAPCKDPVVRGPLAGANYICTRNRKWTATCNS